MKQIHRTRDGEMIPIAEMEDSHLLNTIRLLIRKLVEAKAILDSTQSVFKQTLDGRTGTPALAKAFVEYFRTNISAYTYEAGLRNLDLQGEWCDIRETIERSGRLESFGQAFQITRRDDEVYDVDQDDCVGWGQE